MAASGPPEEPTRPGTMAAAEPYSGPERRQASCADDRMEPVILTKKYAEELNGIELGGVEVGDRLCLSTDEAALIVAEGWAERADPSQRRRSG